MIVFKEMREINGLFLGWRGMALQMSRGQINIADGTWKVIMVVTNFALK